jgi:hypothetical protein
MEMIAVCLFNSTRAIKTLVVAGINPQYIKALPSPNANALLSTVTTLDVGFFPDYDKAPESAYSHNAL